jgi:hypothetical protein
MPRLLPAVLIPTLALLYTPLHPSPQGTSAQVEQACPPAEPPPVALPANAAASLRQALDDAREHQKHV